ncbi:STAS domain-containing protein [Nonomuraea sp. NPDC046802]|uniref:STAS domain-containing protein n=1 Tax=Nonomuraea sp. NPDC046802 TaxID=3154919 RepID=UPI00340338D3
MIYFLPIATIKVIRTDLRIQRRRRNGREHAIDISVDVDSTGRARAVRVAGELDSYTAPELARTLREQLDSSPSMVIVDLVGLDFLDPASLSVLVKASKQARSRNISFSLVLISERFLKILEQTGLRGAFPIYSSASEAFTAEEP